MHNMEMKSKVLQEIMDLMDEKEGDDLKKHPKLMATKIEVAKPEVESEGGLEAEAPLEGAKDGEGEEELSPEMIQQLLEALQGS